MPYFNKSQEENRQKTSLLCLEKGFIHPIPYDLKKIVTEKVYFHFNDDERFLLCALCNNFYTVLRSQNYDKPRKLSEKPKNKRGRPAKKNPLCQATMPVGHAIAGRDDESGINAPLLEKDGIFDSLSDSLTGNKAFKWAFENGIVREGYHRGQLNGPNDVLLLSKVETLEQIVTEDLFGHIDALRWFNK
ncbi:unnamed protein product [Lepeophtheirus salmonis]|uniref:(salmon louse) hypothetical protein n=1 Tax=Lepeophtheirus salmonis TaxID=72036 RepID=A0A7R8H4G5_LEPSM|nr:unnamed protein product [Lepeophtheirus salmonis]CAF2859230.1 unnamed protein product [Lepeophtheirus salmonis]